MIVECLVCLALETQEYYIPKEKKVARIARELFDSSYGKKRSILKTRKIVVNLDNRTDFVISSKRKRFFTVVHYFDI